MDRHRLIAWDEGGIRLISFFSYEKMVILRGLEVSSLTMWQRASEMLVRLLILCYLLIKLIRSGQSGQHKCFWPVGSNRSVWGHTSLVQWAKWLVFFFFLFYSPFIILFVSGSASWSGTPFSDQHKKSLGHSPPNAIA